MQWTHRLEPSKVIDMTTAARTDIHRPSAPEFDPAGYDCLGVFDTHTEEGNQAALRVVTKRALARGYSFHGAPHGSGQCGHCGAHLRYVALMVHVASGTLLHVGEQCLENRFDATKSEFAELRALSAAKRKETREAHARNEMKAVALAWLNDQHLVTLDRLAEISYRGNGGLADGDDYAGSVLSDMGRKLDQYGPLSERQMLFAVKLVDQAIVAANRAARQLAEAQARKASAVFAPEGRMTVSGTVANTWERDSDYGIQYKMRVETEGGWIAIGTIPAAIVRQLDDHKDLRGQVISFAATFEPTRDDATVAWFSRPSKAVIES